MVIEFVNLMQFPPSSHLFLEAAGTVIATATVAAA
jgi:hypothetical protein